MWVRRDGKVLLAVIFSTRDWDGDIEEINFSKIKQHNNYNGGSNTQ